MKKYTLFLVGALFSMSITLCDVFQDEQFNLRNPVVKKENTQDRALFLKQQSLTLKNDYLKAGCKPQYLKEMQTAPRISQTCNQLRVEYLQNKRLEDNLEKDLTRTSANINAP